VLASSGGTPASTNAPTALFEQAIRLADGNQTKAVRWLGITRLKLREKLAESGLRETW
jgi:DNA-binding protein Fis